MHILRVYHTATTLSDGKILVIGAEIDSDPKVAKVYDPLTGNWTMTSFMNVGRSWHTATLLMNGQVLVAGGTDDGVD